MVEWELWTLCGFLAICTVGVVLALWNAEEVEEDDW